MPPPTKPFTKGRDNTKNFELQRQRDARLIQAVEQYATLDLVLLQALFPAESYRTLAFRMQRLSEPRTIRKGPHRPKPRSPKKVRQQQIRTPSFTRTATLDGRAVFTIVSFEKDRDPQWEHKLDSSRFMVTLGLAIRGTSFKITERKYEYELRKESLAPGVIPDIYFALQHGNIERFAVEIDRANEPVTRSNHKQISLLEKALKYYQNRVDCRILIVTLGLQRVENIIQAFRDYHDPKDSTNPYPLRSGRFLITCQEQFSLDEPRTILGPIWGSPKGEGWQSLIS